MDFVGNPEGKRHLEELGIDIRLMLILICIFKKRNGGHGLD
jgi:hypothetical protein